MVAVGNPALAEFVARIGDELAVAQVLIRRVGRGFELRHIADRGALEGTLREVRSDGLRAVAQLTAAGEFRPLKSAPTLVSGWRAVAAGAKELGAALDQLYPGAVADWFAARAHPPVTHYREFTARQTGMYRITTILDDAEAAQVIGECCDARCCLKRRLWTVGTLAADGAAAKSLIPCLEPCAALLEAARKAVRLEQQGGIAHEGHEIH